MRPTKCYSLLLVMCSIGVLVAAGRKGGGGRIGGSSSRRGGSIFSRPKTPAPAPRTPAPHRNDHVNSNNQFLNNERGASTGGTTHNRNPFAPSAPQQPGPINTNGPIGFEKVNGQHSSGSASHAPSAPNYPAAPPAYSPGNTHSSVPGSYSGANDHPPPYPGRPVNAPPSYSSNNPYNPQANAPPPGFNTHTQSNPPIGFNTHTQSNPASPGFNTHNSGPPGYNTQPNHNTGYNNYQQNNYQGQHFPQQNYPNQHGYSGNSHPYPNQYGNAPSFTPYAGNANSFPAFGGSSHSGTYPHTTYQGNAYGGNPFGNGGNLNGNPYYNTNNFGYSSNPGYFGGGYQGGYHPGQYEKKSRFGGLPIPIPIPIPIPLGGFGGFGGFGGGSSSSYNHGLLHSFVRSKSKAPAENTTSIFVLNNSTVTPCTTDHFVYDHLKISVVSCTAENCTAVKIFTTTNSQIVHSAGLTVCLENNATSSHFGDNIALTVSDMKNESFEVCRNVTSNVTGPAKPNSTETTTAKVDGVSLDTNSTTEAPTTVTAETTNTTTNANVTKVCETVECHAVELCFPFVEIVDKCTTADCPFRRTGYKPCVTVKLCRSPTTPVSAFASLNTTISKIDEFNHHQSVYDFANLTLISYHRPVITFDSNCTQNSTAPGCAPVTPATSTPAPPASTTLTLTPGCVSSNSTGPQDPLCTTTTTTTATTLGNSTDVVTTTEEITTTS